MIIQYLSGKGHNQVSSSVVTQVPRKPESQKSGLVGEI